MPYFIDVFPAVIINGQQTGDWVNVRTTANYRSTGPVVDVTSDAIRCYQLTPGGGGGTSTADVRAGDEVGFTVNPNIFHPGPISFYMARVPSGQSIDSWDGSGAVWFKIYEEKPSISASGMTWQSDCKY